MPVTDAINTAGEKFFVYPAWETRLASDGNPPTTSASVSAVVRAMSVVQSAGGQQLDNAQLKWLVTDFLTNRTQPANFARMVDVLMGDTSKTRVHLGDYVTESEKVTRQGETLTAQSQLRGYHFGDAHVGQWWWDNVESDGVVTEFAPVFNPRIDERILANRSSIKYNLATEDAYLFVHPEALLTSAAQTENGQTATLWNLKEAVLAMCWETNTDETYILNPTRAELAVLNGAPTLEDVRLNSGQTLPYYLDSLLHPLGYNWYVEYDTGSGGTALGTFLGTYVDAAAATSANPSPTLDDTFFNTTTGTTWTWNGSAWEDTEATDGEHYYNKDKPKIVVFQKGVGTEKELYYQAPAAALALASSNVNEYSINRRIGDSVNEVTVLGDIERAEVTIELWKGWPATDDSLTSADLDKSDPASSYLAKPTVWRLWVANEAGDYTATRTEITGALDLTGVFSRWIPHRRQAQDPFTYQGGSGKKQRRQILVEYTIDAGVTWAPIPDTFGQPFMLPDQLAILFQGDIPPEELIDAGEDGGVRITCVVEGDARLTHTATRQTHAVNGRVVPLTLDVPQKFQKHWVQSTGDYASVLASEASGAETVDHSTEIQAYAEDMRDDNEVAELDCEFRLPGIHLSYEIGDLLTNIDGREVSLDQASDTAPAPRYPQITKREWRIGQNIETILTVDRGVRASRNFRPSE